MKMNTKQTTWHWPDHVIGKRESRRLREEHNALANSHAELVLIAQAYRNYLKTMAHTDGEVATFHHIEGALARAKEVGHDSR